MLIQGWSPPILSSTTKKNTVRKRYVMNFDMSKWSGFLCGEGGRGRHGVWSPWIGCGCFWEKGIE